VILRDPVALRVDFRHSCATVGLALGKYLAVSSIKNYLSYIRASLPYTTCTAYTARMQSTKPMLHLVIDPDLLHRLDDFRFEKRFQSRAAAIVWLLAHALDEQPQPLVAETRSNS
jgi:hypothetical protein